VLIFAAILAIFVYGMIAAMLGTILPDLSDRFHLTPTQNGTIAFSQALGLMIASVGVGPLLDTEGDKAGLILGLLFIVIALFWLPRSKGFRSIVFLLFLLGVGGGIVVTGANALVSGVSEAHRATALNLVNLFFGLGGLATPFISANVFKKNWVRLCYTVASLTVVALMIQAFAKMPAPSGGAGFVLADAGSVLGRPLLFLLGFLLFLYVSCEVGVWNWLPRHLIAQGIPESRALNILSLGFALGLLVGRVGVSPILIHVPAVTVTLAASVAMAVSYIPDAEDEQAGGCGRAGVYCGPVDGSCIPDYPGDGWQCLSAHERNSDRLCDYLRMGWAGGEFALDRRDCGRRSSALEESAVADSRRGSCDGGSESGHLVGDAVGTGVSD
jgi:fucose permease